MEGEGGKPVPSVSREEERASHELGAKAYVLVFAALVVLALLTWGLSRIHLGEWNLIVALGIAATKASLVVLFFMHLWSHKGGSRLAVAVSLTFVALLISLTLADLRLRLPVTLPPTSRFAEPYFKGRPPLPAGDEPVLSPGKQPHFEGP